MIGEVLALDIDDTKKLTTQNILRTAYDLTGIYLKPEDCIKGEYYFDKAYPSCGISSDGWAEIIDVYMRKHSVNVEPFFDVVEAVEKLSRICDIHIVTARDPDHTEPTYDWLERHFDTTVFKGIHIVGSKEGAKKTTKTDTYRAIGATSTADDADHNIGAAIESGLTGFSVQYPGVYHCGHRLDERAIVVSSLTEILNYADIPVR